MKISKKSRDRIRELNAEADRWLKANKFAESEYAGEVFGPSTPITPAERRQILGAGARKAISIRIPENDLAEIQKIAEANGRKYQQLIVLAVEQYIDNYHRLKKMKKLRC